MVETAAHLADNAIVHLPVWQWELSVPKRLRYCFNRLLKTDDLPH
jgi:hypothetical protein